MRATGRSKTGKLSKFAYERDCTVHKVKLHWPWGGVEMNGVYHPTMGATQHTSSPLLNITNIASSVEVLPYFTRTNIAKVCRSEQDWSKVRLTYDQNIDLLLMKWNYACRDTTSACRPQWRCKHETLSKLHVSNVCYVDWLTIGVARIFSAWVHFSWPKIWWPFFSHHLLLHGHIRYICHQYLICEGAPVSYTHLTLPTKRIV